MFDHSVHRIGFACKYRFEDYTQPKKVRVAAEAVFNGRSTTAAWLGRQTKDEAYTRLYEIVVDNVQCYYKLVEYASTLAPHLRLLRLGSDVFPMFTHNAWKSFYTDTDILKVAERELAKVGALAKKHDVRLSMHPGQFTVLASETESIVIKSIEEMEYHATVAQMMGYGDVWHDFKINVHISGRKGPQGILDALPRLSTPARNMLTIENEEVSWGLEQTLELADKVALVLDIHHHWVREGEYIQPTDDKWKRVIDSWRGVRPTIHYSLSRLDVLHSHNPDMLPNMEELLEQGYKKSKLRAHSDTMWNNVANDWAVTFLPDADIMVEAKHKNRASIKLYEDHVHVTNGK